MAKKKQKSDNKMAAGVSLSDAISMLRTQLAKAESERNEGDPILVVKEIEVELAMRLQHEGTAGGKVNWWVYEAGIEGKRASEQTHRLKVKLQAKDSNDEDMKISDEG